MWMEGLVKPWFSIAIQRPPAKASAGPGVYLALGGLAPIPHSKNFAKAPIVTLPGSPMDRNTGQPVKDKYSIVIEGVAYGSPECTNGRSEHTFNRSEYFMIVDSGTPFNVFPPETAVAINALFEPPAVALKDPDHPGMFVVDCTVEAPQLGIKIGGQILYHDPDDLIVFDGSDGCLSVIVSNTAFAALNEGAINILGNSFMNNVVSVFYVRNSEIRSRKDREFG